MKVYLATSGEYDDYRVLRVFAHRADAEAYELADDVEECEVATGPAEVRAWHQLQWAAWIEDREADSVRAANPSYSTERRDVEYQPADVTHEWRKQPHGWANTSAGQVQEIVHALTVGGWDLGQVQAVYAEQRAEYEAKYGAKPHD